MSVKALQRQTNRFAPTLGFPRLTADGLMGPKTVSAVTTVAKYLTAKGYSESMVVASVAKGAGGNYILTNQMLITDSFKQAADELGIASAKTPTPKPTTLPTTTTPTKAGFPFVPVLIGLGVMWALVAAFSRRR